MPFSVGQVLGASALNAVTLTTGSATVYTPTIANGGTATFTTNTGWYFEIGSSIVFFCAYFQVNAGGSGASNVTITSPTNVDRTTRQVVGAVRETSGGPRSEGGLVAFTGGSGAVWDRMYFGATDLTGANLSAGSIHTFQGWYRAA